MRTGPELIKATKPFAVDSTARSWWYVLSTAALLAGALTGTLWDVPWGVRLFFSVLAGLLVLRLFVIYHDQQHHAILPRSRVAEVLMRVFGVLALSPSSVWRSSHNYHHNHNSKLRSAHIGSFPVMTKAQYLKSSPGERRLYLFTRHPLTILFGYVFIFLHGMCLYPFWNTPKKSVDCLVALVVHGLIAAGLIHWVGWQGWVFTQVVPHFVACAIGSYLFYAQHNFPSVEFADKSGWTYEKAALESSSFMRTGPIMGWFTGNIGYHHIHHLNARIPFYRLPEVLRALPELQQPKTTSLHPLDILRCLRLKVWDVEAQQMMPLPRE
ncbi:MAG: fatty acid desaturase [Verrucomicrobia bacterium]|jgi:omega-6 fatty acid desaturase (delta-12 desaturase)|nr:fatty acid desaturase [Verrucomicrobiota bacterium]